MWLLYNILFPIAFILMLPKFLSRMARRGGYKRHCEQRFGMYGAGATERFSEARRVWIHAVSVGEINVALRFIEEYRIAEPDALFVLSTTTSTAHTIGCEKMDDRDVLIYFPIDIPFVMKKVFNAINPVRLVLVECEFWPNMIREAHRRGIPVSLINGRVSDSSFKGYMKLRPLMKQVLELIDPICVQGRQDAERMIAMGAIPDSVKTPGTAKYDLPPPAGDADVPARGVLSQVHVGDDAFVLLGGSTWPGEEKVLCEIYKALRDKHPELFLVLVPRHAERRDEVVEAVSGAGLSYVLRSRMEDDSVEKPDVLIADTTGELMGFYAAADIVFVGKSLCEHGGQNPIEPALFGRPIVVGPNMENFPSVMDDFLSSEALLQVESEAQLKTVIGDLVADSSLRDRIGSAAAKLVESRRGVVTAMVKEITGSAGGS